MEALTQLREYWATNTLRPGRLGAWQMADGIVAFPARPVRDFLAGKRHIASLVTPTRAATRGECGLVLHCPLDSTSGRVRFRVHRF